MDNLVVFGTYLINTNDDSIDHNKTHRYSCLLLDVRQLIIL